MVFYKLNYMVLIYIYIYRYIYIDIYICCNYLFLWLLLTKPIEFEGTRCVFFSMVSTLPLVQVPGAMIGAMGLNNDHLVR